MTRITLDADLRRRLLDLKQPLELCDETGRVVGRLFPTVDLSGYDLTEPPISEEELQRRMNEPRYSTAEVLAHLEQL